MWQRHKHPRPNQSDSSNADNWRRLFDQLDRIERKQRMADMTLDDILAETTAEQTADASIVQLLSGLQTQLTQALNGQTISPAAQAKVNRIFANMQANIGTITAAVQANTPVAPTDTPAVPVAAGTTTGTTIAAPPASTSSTVVSTDPAVAPVPNPLTEPPVATTAPTTPAPAPVSGL